VVGITPEVPAKCFVDVEEDASDHERCNSPDRLSSGLLDQYHYFDLLDDLAGRGGIEERIAS